MPLWELAQKQILGRLGDVPDGVAGVEALTLLDRIGLVAGGGEVCQGRTALKVSGGRCKREGVAIPCSRWARGILCIVRANKCIYTYTNLLFQRGTCMINPPTTSRSTPFWIGAAVLSWFTAVVVASSTGWLGSLPPLAPPPIAALTMMIPMIGYFAVPAFRLYIARVGIRRLTAIHVLRIAAAPLFFWYGAHQLLPRIFVERAAWGDISAGLLALLAVTLWQRSWGYWLAHLFGIAYSTPLSPSGRPLP